MSGNCSGTARRGLRLWLSVALMGLLAAGIWVFVFQKQAEAYAEDLEDHSTFHYELVRTLAFGAGFNEREAELVALSSQAVDSETYTGDIGVTVSVAGTTRTDEATRDYWHGPRRASSPTIAGTSYPGGRDTCAYFVGSDDPCGEGAPELSFIEDWAYGGGTGSLSQGREVPDVTITRSSGTVTNIDWSLGGRDDHRQRLASFGIYLHSLADSYSHEACMEAVQIRTHSLVPEECNVQIWHGDKEFGTEPDDKGVPYTIEAGEATWIMAKAFGEQIGAGAQRLTDAEATEFIEAFAQTESAADRSALANSTYDQLASGN